MSKPVDDLLDLFGGPPQPQVAAIAPVTNAIVESKFLKVVLYVVMPNGRVEEMYSSRGLKITFLVDGKNYGNDGLCSILFKISNETSNPMGNFTFQIAVPKGVDQKLEPLSSSLIPPLNASAPVTQVMHIRNTARTPLKVRFRIAYFVNGQPFGDQGESGVLIS